MKLNLFWKSVITFALAFLTYYAAFLGYVIIMG